MCTGQHPAQHPHPCVWKGLEGGEERVVLSLQSDRIDK